MPAQAQAEMPAPKSGADSSEQWGSVAAPDLTLSETLRVLEVARNLRGQRDEAEVALARQEVREILRKKLLDAAAVTGDKVTEREIDAAINQYFDRLYAYHDPAPSTSVFLANLYVRRTQIALVIGSLAAAATAWFVFF